ncbi:MAG: hypothetical protein QM791_16275 [Ferruginibacter sp.]
MNINRTNYEEFFLLYIDNELSVAEKNAVDFFLLENPDLQEELLMLKQSVVKPESIVFDNKKQLLKPETIAADLQEKLLFHLDAELNKKETAVLEQLIKTDAATKKEWDILQQTKLQPDTTVIFKDKHLLYKKEAGRVVGMRWWRMAAAAVLVGFGIWGTTMFLSKSSTNPGTELVKSHPAKGNNTTAEKTLPAEQPKTAVANETASVNREPVNNASSTTNKLQPIKKQITVPVKEEQNTAVVKQDKEEEKEITSYKPYLEKLNREESNNNAIAIVTPEKQHSKVNEMMNATKQADKIMGNNLDNNDAASNQSIAVQASFKEENTNDITYEENNDNRKGKTKVGAFFKKVKRILERKTNTENSDNTIKVANLSFAVQ